MHNLLSPAARPATHTEDVEEVTVYLPRKLVLAWRSAVASENAALQRPPLTPEEWQRKLNAYLFHSLRCVTEMANTTARALHRQTVEATVPTETGGAQ